MQSSGRKLFLKNLCNDGVLSCPAMQPVFQFRAHFSFAFLDCSRSLCNFSKHLLKTPLAYERPTPHRFMHQAIASLCWPPFSLYSYVSERLFPFLAFSRFSGPCRSEAKVVKVRTIDFIKRIIVLVPTTIPQNPHRLLELRYGPDSTR